MERKWTIPAIGLVAATLATLALLLFVSPSGLPTHMACWNRSPGLVLIHLVGDVMIWCAYAAIPFLILYLLSAGRMDRTSPITFPGLLGCGALFVWCCGQTHLLDAIEIWWQIQWTRGVMKLVTGVVSWVFVLLMLRQRRRLASVARAIYRAVETEMAE